MISDVVKKRSQVRFGKRTAIDPAKASKPGVYRATERKLMSFAIAAMAGMMAIAPTAIAQASMVPTGVQSAAETTQRSTCAADSQGLMCDVSNRELQAEPPVKVAQASPASLLPLSNAQMEHIADILLALLYFVLPTGFGIALFLHDRQQAQRMATLEAQINFLEKLWEQTPQA